MRATTRLDRREEHGKLYWRKFPAVILNHREVELVIKLMVSSDPFRQELSETLANARMLAAVENRADATEVKP